jgi:hypothetical protein
LLCHMSIMARGGPFCADSHSPQSGDIGALSESLRPTKVAERDRMPPIVLPPGSDED